jgi:hypothetical protein
MYENLLRSFFASREDIEGIHVLSGDSLYSVGSNKLDKERQKKTESVDNKDFWTSIGLKK